jgi:hypothetical protein
MQPGKGPPLNLRKISWHGMPPEARWGIVLWTAAWISFLFHYYGLTHDGGSIAKIAVAVGLLLFFLLKGQNWARMIALMAGALSILFLSFLAYISQAVHSVSPLVIIAMFAFAMYFLTRRTTADYFKSMSKLQSPSK